MIRFPMRFLVFAILLASSFPVNAQNDALRVVLRDSGKAVEVTVDGKGFVNYDYTSYKKPVFYPVFGPAQIPMTRSYPMKNVSGESDDHPHHKSVWLGHEINGVDFWSEKGGSVQLKKIVTDAPKARFTASHDWIENRSGKMVVEDQTQISFDAQPNLRWIDYSVTFDAKYGEVVFEDTKEGFFAIRVHPSLRHQNDPKRGVQEVTGKMVNSNNQSGKQIWGKNASWVCYHGKIDGQRCGVVMFDHPQNFRHPTTWHARDYGLLAANPFGLRHFKNKKPAQGQLRLEPGKQITFRYRLLFFSGEFDAGKIGKQFVNFSKE